MSEEGQCAFYVNPFSQDDDPEDGRCGEPGRLQLFKNKITGEVSRSYRCTKHRGETNTQWEPVEEENEMNKEVKARNTTDADGNPAGGEYHATGIIIHWQDGPVQNGVPNGAQVEDVLELCLLRLQFFQDSKFACEENAEAINHIRRSLDSLNERTARE